MRMSGSPNSRKASIKAVSLPAVMDMPSSFLLEWWSTFWEVFVAKVNPSKGSEAGRVYAEAQVVKQQSLIHQQFGDGGGQRWSGGSVNYRGMVRASLGLPVSAVDSVSGCALSGFTGWAHVCMCPDCNVCPDDCCIRRLVIRWAIVLAAVS